MKIQGEALKGISEAQGRFEKKKSLSGEDLANKKHPTARFHVATCANRAGIS